MFFSVIINSKKNNTEEYPDTLFVHVLLNSVIGLFQHSRKYMNVAKTDNPPHIFAIADQAYQMMMHQKKNQVK